MVYVDEAGNIVEETTPLRGVVRPSGPSGPLPGKRLGGISFVFWGNLLAFLASVVLTAFLFNNVTLWLAVLLGWLVSLTLHEFGHAWTAYRGGDRSVETLSYLDLDVRRYGDPINTFLIPSVFLMMGGLPLPGGSVLLQTANLPQKWAVYTALAGPLASLLCGVVASLMANGATVIRSAALQRGWLLQPMALPLAKLAGYQVFAFLLNLLPIPPLDGWNAVSVCLPDDFVVKRLLRQPDLRLIVNILSFFILLLIIREVAAVHQLHQAICSLIGVPISF